MEKEKNINMVNLKLKANIEMENNGMKKEKNIILIIN